MPRYIDPAPFVGHSLRIEKEAEAETKVKCDGDMLLAEQLTVSCTEDNLSFLEPILISVSYRNWVPGGFNYQVKVQARYEPDAIDELHVWIGKDVLESDKDRKYFSDVPESVINTIKVAVPPHKTMCGGYLTFCRFEISPLGFYVQAMTAIIEGIVELIQVDWQQLSDEEIGAIFKRPTF